jgi:hypothetical protein
MSISTAEAREQQSMKPEDVTPYLGKKKKGSFSIVRIILLFNSLIN